MSGVDARYATALFSLAATSADADEIGGVLSAIAAAYTQNGDLRAFLRNPVLSDAVKKELLAKLAGGAKQPVLNFLYVLIDNARIGELAAICKCYTALIAETRQAITIMVTSAFPLDDSEIAAIKRRYSAQYGGRTIELETRVDAKLMGGIRVQIGDMLVDDTLSGKLKQLYRRMA